MVDVGSNCQQKSNGGKTYWGGYETNCDFTYLKQMRVLNQLHKSIWVQNDKVSIYIIPWR